jgi:hypothetical protein
LMIGIFLYFTKTFFKDAAKVLRTKPLISFFTGLLYFVATPVIAMILLITIIGLPFAIALALLYAISLLFAKALTAIVLTRALELQYKKKWSMLNVFIVSLVIFLALKLIMIIPFIGWIATMIAVLIGYGAVLLVKFDRVKKVL